MKQGERHDMFYLAIVCPPEIDQEIHAFKLWIQSHCQSVNALKSPGHITLVPPFWFPASREQELHSHLTAFRSPTANITIELSGFSHFGKRVIYVEVQENKALAQLYMDAVQHFEVLPGTGIKRDERSFHPHVTIATRDLRPSMFRQAWEHFSGMSFESGFSADRISLFKLNTGKWQVCCSHLWQ
jgi:2'-5' RNA ligase